MPRIYRPMGIHHKSFSKLSEKHDKEKYDKEKQDKKPSRNSLPYRKGVQAYIISNEKLFFVTNVGDGYFWKVPSGGMDPGEAPEDTVKREMQEELSVKIHILKKCHFKNRFLWPMSIVQKSNYTYKGQEQFIFIVKIHEGEKIKINKHEISHHRWVKFRDLNKVLPLPSQKSMAARVLREYKNLKNK